MSFPGMLALIEIKKMGGQLGSDLIQGWIRELVAGKVPDYQNASLLMAIRLNGMTFEETLALTIAMAESGERLNFPGYPLVADKHSTGGVGDKVTLVLGPMVAACGLAVSMLSGRALGFSGGTIDKFESIEGVSCRRTGEEMLRMIQEFGWANAQATEAIAPADRILYALRDVTGTVDSIPLITASILSKKLSGGATHLCLDVKCGSGAFMTDLTSATHLADNLKRIGEMGGMNICGLVSRMEEPLGHAIGNYLEVMESLAYLRKPPETPLMALVLELGIAMLRQGGLAKGDEDARTMLLQSIHNGSAVEKLLDYLRFCGATTAALEGLCGASFTQFKRVPVLATQSGYVTGINSRTMGLLGLEVGAGRKKADDLIDPMAGFLLEKHLGDSVSEGDVLAWVYGDLAEVIEQSTLIRLRDAFELGPTPKPVPELVLHRF